MGIITGTGRYNQVLAEGPQGQLFGPGVGTESSRDGDEGTAEQERDSELPDAGGQGRNRQETPECRDRTSKGRNLKGGRVLQEF